MDDRIPGFSLRGQRLKWVVVVGLAAVLVAIVVFGNGDAPDAGGAAARAGARPRLPVAPSASDRVRAQGLRWKGAAPSDEEFEQTLHFDPFAPRLALQQLQATVIVANAPPTPEQTAEKSRNLALQQRMQEFQGKKVSVVFRMSDGRAAALVGGRLIRQGEVLDGIKVVSISAAGIVLEAAKVLPASDQNPSVLNASEPPADAPPTPDR